MTTDEEDRMKVKRVMERVREEYGFIPLVSEVLSERPDLFLPYSEMSSNLFFKPRHLDRQTAELAAIAAGTAVASTHCLDVHIVQALKLGLSEEAIMEAMLVGSFMSMNRSNAIALRCLKAAKEGGK
jgi:AhpD family alkylhydroperoxidase